MMSEKKYDYNTAFDEANKLKEIAGDKATNEDYDTAEKLSDAEHETLLQQQIAKAKSIRDLITILQKEGETLMGSTKIIDVAPMIGALISMEKYLKNKGSFDSSPMYINKITRKYGLRKKVCEIANIPIED